MVGNIGFIFTNGELGAIRDVIEEHRVPAPARVGSVAPTDVKVPPGPTGCDPGQTSFFQVLQVCVVVVLLSVWFRGACCVVRCGMSCVNEVRRKMYEGLFCFGGFMLTCRGCQLNPI